MPWLQHTGFAPFDPLVSGTVLLVPEPVSCPQCFLKFQEALKPQVEPENDWGHKWLSDFALAGLWFQKVGS